MRGFTSLLRGARRFPLTGTTIGTSATLSARTILYQSSFLTYHDSNYILRDIKANLKSMKYTFFQSVCLVVCFMWVFLCGFIMTKKMVCILISLNKFLFALVFAKFLFLFYICVITYVVQTVFFFLFLIFVVQCFDSLACMSIIR